MYVGQGDAAKSGPAFDACAESLRACLEKAVLDMTVEEQSAMTAAAREYSMQFDKANVFSLLEEKADAVVSSPLTRSRSLLSSQATVAPSLTAFWTVFF